jgi:hypothetical protein
LELIKEKILKEIAAPNKIKITTIITIILPLMLLNDMEFFPLYF